MDLGGTKEKHKEWGQAAFARLQQDGLPPSPENYALFFAYYSGRIPDLNMSVDTLTTQFGGLSQEQASHLHAAHLGAEAERRALADANSALDVELKKVMGVLDQANRGAHKFDATLSSFSGELNTQAHDADLGVLREIVSRVAVETKLIAEQNNRLQTQLLQSSEQMAELRYNLDKVKQESFVDPLTEVGNRKFFQQEIERLIQEASELDVPLALLMIDIDFFKKFNDTHGHLVGDQVLKLVGKTLRENVKGRDVVARYGGEEFAVILPQTPRDAALRVADQLRVAIGTKQITRKSNGEHLGTITFSVGVAQWQRGEAEQQWIERADQALYRAKQLGRNRAVLADDPAQPSH